MEEVIYPMGEIRSTLDIIMEKAKNVEVTDADKAAFLKRETEGKIRGFLQRYLDGALDSERLRGEIASLGDDRYEIALSVLRRECLDRMVPGGDNRGLLNILSQVAGFDIRPVEELIRGYQKDLEAEQAKRKALLKDRLRDRGISGSAVMPNLEADPEWISYSAEASDRFHQELASLHTRS